MAFNHEITEKWFGAISKKGAILFDIFGANFFKILESSYFKFFGAK